jgi:TRAP-type transport system small permease protein
MTDPLPEAAVEPSGLEPLYERHGGRIVRAIRRANAVLHHAAGATMLALLLWTVIDIVGRSVFGSPMRGTVELTELAVVVLVYLGLGHVEHRDAHISVDLLFVRLGTRGQLVMRVVASSISLAVVALLTWRLYLFAGQLQAGGYTTGVLRVPLHPVAIVGVVGAAGFFLAILTNLVLVLRELLAGSRGGR